MSPLDEDIRQAGVLRAAAASPDAARLLAGADPLVAAMVRWRDAPSAGVPAALALWAERRGVVLKGRKATEAFAEYEQRLLALRDAERAAKALRVAAWRLEHAAAAPFSPVSSRIAAALLAVVAPDGLDVFEEQIGKEWTRAQNQEAQAPADAGAAGAQRPDQAGSAQEPGAGRPAHRGGQGGHAGAVPGHSGAAA